MTREIAGVGGRFKAEPEDFVVEEVPLYPPSGEGEHTFLRLEKRGISTFEAIRRLARAVGVRERDVGYAGMKDARAVTTQWVSLAGVPPAEADGLELAKLRVLEAHRHSHKLRKGHLAGNRFRCVLRGVDAAGEARAREILARLTQQGVPHAFGPQRFGEPPLNHLAGRALLRGEPAGVLAVLLGPLPEESAASASEEPARRDARAHYHAGDVAAALNAWPPRCNQERRMLKALLDGADAATTVKLLPKKLKELYVNAYQSALFNRLLAERLKAEALAALEEGDVAYKHANGACFVVEDAARETERAPRFEISPAGPLFGTKTLAAKGEPGAREQALLDAEGIAFAHFALPGGLAQRGERRPYRVPVKEAQLVWNEPSAGCCTVSFTLPPGAYATNVLAELTKSAATFAE